MHACTSTKRTAIYLYLPCRKAGSAMSSDRQYSSYPGTPITYPRASRRMEEQPRTRQQTRQQSVDDEENDDAWAVEKPHTSAYRYDYPVTPPRNATRDTSNPKRTKLIKQRRFDRYTLITWLCLAIIVMAGGWFLFSKIADWWTGVHDNMLYGTPFRTFQVDEYMGMGDTPAHPDHFIALNLHGVIEVIQMNPVDRKKDAVYVLANVGDDNTPASLSFRDTTGSGRTDVIVTIGDTTPYTIILINNGTTLTPTQPAH